MSATLASAGEMYEKVEAANQSSKGSGFVDATVHFGRLVDRRPTEQEEIVNGILDVDLDDCSKEYRKEFVRTWRKLAARLDEIAEEES